MFFVLRKKLKKAVEQKRHSFSARSSLPRHPGPKAPRPTIMCRGRCAHQPTRGISWVQVLACSVSDPCAGASHDARAKIDGTYRRPQSGAASPKGRPEPRQPCLRCLPPPSEPVLQLSSTVQKEHCRVQARLTLPPPSPTAGIMHEQPAGFSSTRLLGHDSSSHKVATDGNQAVIVGARGSRRLCTRGRCSEMGQLRGAATKTGPDKDTY